MSFPIDFVWRLLLAAVLGAAVGLEREYREKPAGLRTNILIALGAALFTILSIVMGGGSGPAGSSARRSCPASVSSAGARSCGVETTSAA